MVKKIFLQLWKATKSWALPIPPSEMLFITKEWNMGSAWLALLAGVPIFYDGLSSYFGGDDSFFFPLNIFVGFMYCWFFGRIVLGYALHERINGHEAAA